EQAADQGEEAHPTRLRVDRLLHLLERRRRVDLERREAAALESLDGLRDVDRAVEDTDQGGHLSAPPNERRARGSGRGSPAPSPRRSGSPGTASGRSGKRC